MVEIQNKRLMLSEGIECDFTPNLNDFMFFGGGGGKGGGGTKVVYVPKIVKETVVKNTPNAPKQQEGASNMNEDGVTPDDDETIGGRNKTLGGTRKLAIPVTPSR